MLAIEFSGNDFFYSLLNMRLNIFGPMPNVITIDQNFFKVVSLLEKYVVAMG